MSHIHEPYWPTPTVAFHALYPVVAKLLALKSVPGSKGALPDYTSDADVANWSCLSNYIVGVKKICLQKLVIHVSTGM